MQQFFYVISVWIVGGSLGVIAVLTGLVFKHPDVISSLIRALTP